MLGTCTVSVGAFIVVTGTSGTVFVGVSIGIVSYITVSAVFSVIVD